MFSMVLSGGEYWAARQMVQDEGFVRGEELAPMLTSSALGAGSFYFLSSDCASGSVSKKIAESAMAEEFSFSDKIILEFLSSYNGKGYFRRWIRSVFFDATIGREDAEDLIGAALHASIIAVIVDDNSPDRPVEIEDDRIAFFLSNRLPSVVSARANEFALQITSELIEYLRNGGELSLDGGSLTMKHGRLVVITDEGEGQVDGRTRATSSPAATVRNPMPASLGRAGSKGVGSAAAKSGSNFELHKAAA